MFTTALLWLGLRCQCLQLLILCQINCWCNISYTSTQESYQIPHYNVKKRQFSVIFVLFLSFKRTRGSSFFLISDFHRIQMTLNVPNGICMNFPSSGGECMPSHKQLIFGKSVSQTCPNISISIRQHLCIDLSSAHCDDWHYHQLYISGDCKSVQRTSQPQQLATWRVPAIRYKYTTLCTNISGRRYYVTYICGKT